MANKKILIEVGINDKATPEIKKTDGAVKGLSSSVNILNKEQREQIVVEQKSKIVKKAQIDSLKRQAAAELQVAAATKQVKTSSGLNNAILLESGRLASDAAYGFQGIANNLGQLVSLFQISAKNAGGFGAALRQVGGQILGTGGVLIGIQLLISFLPQISKWFNSSSKEALKNAEAIKELTKSISDQIELLERLTFKSLPDFIISGKALEETVSFLSDTFTEFRRGMEILKEKGLDKNEEAVRDLINSYERLKKLQKQNITTNEEYRQSAKKEGETSLKSIKLLGKYKRELREIITLKNLFNRTRLKDEPKDEPKDKLLSLKKDFVSGELDFDREIEKSAARVTKSLQENKDKQIQIQADSVKELAIIRQKDFADAQQKRVDAIKDEEDKSKAQIKLNIEIAESQESLNAYIEQIQKEAERNKDARRLFDLEKASAQLEKLQGAEKESRMKFDILMEDMDLNRIEKQRTLDELATENKIKLLNRELSHAESVGNSTLAIREKINNVNAEASRASIKLDELEFETKKAHLMNLGSAIVEFAGESSTAGKAVSIAMAIVNTEEAITEALALPYPFNFVAAAAVGLKGASSIKKILSTKIPGKEPSSSGASGGEVVNAPDFNVVGTSETSQLAQAVGQTSQSQLVKAFVVGSEVTSQQEFDRKITNNAGL